MAIVASVQAADLVASYVLGLRVQRIFDHLANVLLRVCQVLGVELLASCELEVDLQESLQLLLPMQVVLTLIGLGAVEGVVLALRAQLRDRQELVLLWTLVLGLSLAFLAAWARVGS